jgi:excisionase family DNA binding protein
MEALTFDQLHQSVLMLSREIQELKRLLIENNNQAHTDDKQEDFLTVQEAAGLLRLSAFTIYSKVSLGQLPAMKRGKRLYFSRTELLDYVKDGRKKSNAEIEQEANAYLSNTKKGLNYGK